MRGDPIDNRPPGSRGSGGPQPAPDRVVVGPTLQDANLRADTNPIVQLNRLEGQRWFTWSAFLIAFVGWTLFILRFGFFIWLLGLPSTAQEQQGYLNSNSPFAVFLMAAWIGGLIGITVLTSRLAGIGPMRKLVYVLEGAVLLFLAFYGADWVAATMVATKEAGRFTLGALPWGSLIFWTIAIVVGILFYRRWRGRHMQRAMQNSRPMR